MRVAVYIRVSTQEQAQKGFSVAAQQELAENLCKSQGWEITDLYIDEGFSGKSLKRPQIRRLISHARERLFDVVIVWKLDRISRKQKDVLWFIEDVLEPNMIGFKSITQPFDTTTPAGKAMIGMLAVYAQLEVETTIERSKFGLARRTREGLWSGRAPYGYTYNFDTGILEIDPITAPLVKKIFDLYLEGNGLSLVSDWLKDHKVPSPYFRNPGSWNFSTIHVILRNRAYCGYRRQRTKEGHTWVKSKHEPIIDEVTYTRVQKEMQYRHETHARTGSRVYLLSGVAYCTNCGSKLRSKRQLDRKRKDGTRNVMFYYVCRDRFFRNVTHDECDFKYLRCDPLETRVVQAIGKLALDRKAVYDMVAATAPHETESSDRLAMIEKEYRNIDRKIARYLDAFENESMDTSIIRKRIDDLQERRQEFDQERRALEADVLTENEDQMTADQLTDLILDFPHLYELATPEEQKALLQAILERIDVSPDGSFQLTFKHFIPTP